jgi:integrase
MVSTSSWAARHRGTGPIDWPKGARAEAAVAAASTFKECAERYIKDNEAKWSKKHAAQWPSSLKQYAYPTIGDLRIAEILPSHIFELLKPIWIEKRETSKRVRGRIETIIAKNVDINDNWFRNPAELTKQLREKFPKRPKRKPRHHPPCPTPKHPNSCLSWPAPTAARRRAWSSVDRIDRPRAIWKIPGERMKMDEDHSVPLSDPALAILAAKAN